MLRTFTRQGLALALLLGLASCHAGAPQPKEATEPSPQEFNLLKHNFSDVLTCLPKENTLITAHRGTSRAWDIPENSVEALTRLIDAGTLIAEIDVAGLKSGEQILYHDGVWDRKSTGKGPVASTTWQEAKTFLLKSYAGTLSAERPPLFSTILDIAKNEIFLEIDFKSSAKTEEVLKLIRERDMAGQVVLIAYTSERAKALKTLAPEMLISAPGEDKGRGLNPSKTLLWMGRNLSPNMEPTDTVGYIGLVSKDDNLSEKSSASVFLVSDWPTDHSAILGELDKNAMTHCLENK